MSKSSIRTAAGRRMPVEPPRSNMADGAVNIRAWAQLLVERGNRLFERAERERVALVGTRNPSPRISVPAGEAAPGRFAAGESRRARGRNTAAGAKPG